MRRKRPIMLTLILLLLLSGGAIVNIAVAWAIYGYHYSANGSFARVTSLTAIEYQDNRPAALDLWHRHGNAAWPKQLPPFWSESKAFGFWGREIFDSRPGPSTTSKVMPQPWVAGGFRVMNSECGFPMKCCSLDQWQESGTRKYPGLGPLNHNGILISSAPFPSVALWPGFAINTILYAVILWLIFFVPGKVRRAIRRRRGLCPACAYPVGTSEVCTECGNPVSKRLTISGQHSALDSQS